MHDSAATVVVPRDLLWELTDPDDCWFDHHGGCQAHGFLDLEPGQVCPQEQAKRLLGRPVAPDGIAASHSASSPFSSRPSGPGGTT